MLDLEVSQIWKSRWNVTKVLYLLARYLPFMDIPVLLYHQFAPSPPLTICNATYKYQACMSIELVEVVLTVRTWAVWNKDWRLTFGLFTTLALTTAAEFYLVSVYLKSSHHNESPIPSLIGCFITTSSSKLAICFAIFMAFDGCMYFDPRMHGCDDSDHDLGILALMVIRGIAVLKSGGDSQLLRIVYGDGVIYYVYIFGLSLINVVIIYKLPVRTILSLICYLRLMYMSQKDRVHHSSCDVGSFLFLRNTRSS
ncbi:hypothetical protein AN958_06855 [Leucoagaricus sp. SymC.cos]|nr:hypothetical protein AN958_06855 [Leucoagaricus sp. SymC.cos]